MRPLAALLLATTLPDPGAPGWVPLAATLGGVAGGSIARLLGFRDDRLRRVMTDGTLAGGWLGLPHGSSPERQMSTVDPDPRMDS